MDQLEDTSRSASESDFSHFHLASGSSARQSKEDAATPAEDTPSQEGTSEGQHSLSRDDSSSDHGDQDPHSEQDSSPDMPDLPPVDPEIKARDFSPVELSLTTYVIQQISCPTIATYNIFWVQDTENESYIAVVGVDYEGNGHFIYKNPPSYNVPDGLNVTNRNEAIEWVVSQGALQEARDPERMYTDLDLHDVELIKAGLSLWPKPQFHKPYNSYEVITDGKAGTEDEAKARYFDIVLEEDGTENACVAVSSSAGGDGSRVLIAADVFGGMILESTEEAEEWVKYILGQSPGPDGPLKLSTILRFKEAKGDKLPLPDLPFNSARPVPRPARPENPNLRTNAGSRPMRPGGSSALPHYDFAEEFAYRVNLGTQVDPDFEVLNVCKGFPELAEFSLGTPDVSLIQKVKGYAKALSGFIDDEQPKEAIFDQNRDPMEWVPTAKAMEILKDLEHMKVSLTLLEVHRLAHKVARLRTHWKPEISAIAVRLTDTWKDLALRLISRAKSVMGHLDP